MLLSDDLAINVLIVIPVQRSDTTRVTNPEVDGIWTLL